MILQRSQKFPGLSPLVLLLGFVSQIVSPPGDEPVHNRPFCHRRAVDSRARGNRNAGIRNNWMVYDVIGACSEQMKELKSGGKR